MDQLIDYGADAHRFFEAASYPNLHLARVISQYKDQYRIVTGDGACLAGISGKLRHASADPSLLPAVGDFVMTDCADGRTAIIHAVLPRKSVFTRAAAGTDHRTQVVAANIDTVFVCMSLNSDYNLSRLERYLSVAWSSGATPVIVLTKSDLCENLPTVTAEVASAAPDTDTIVTSAIDSAAIDRLLPYLRPGMTASLIGSSGVGKSTLINRLAGEDLLQTSPVRQDDKGRHTTTRRELLVLPCGGIVIDTPGMRALGAETVDLSRSFPDMDELAGRCRFRDCTHTSEPGCAVLAALEAGTLDARRLESYRKLKREARYDGLSFKELEYEKQNAMFAQIGGMKNVRKYIRQNDKRTRGR
ncbi:MAG: ribosome small subunit-dependent GTPase A [Clostridiaceae bacterium]|nr:ribosome small subunit-dependent GTPase A [Clostridiaceae bacterium]